MLNVTLKKPGLFVTGTDTGVGKTVVACAVAACLSRAGQRVGVCKPVASGCGVADGGLVNEDAQLLKHWSKCEQPLEVINPIRYEKPVAPAAAASDSPDWRVLDQALGELDRSHDCLVIEGVGGLLVPLDVNDPKVAVLDLIRAIGYPVLVVARAGLGTLNHTAMTVRLLRESGCKVAGLVVNGGAGGAGGTGGTGGVGVPGVGDDLSLGSNGDWLERMNDVEILGSTPYKESAWVESAIEVLSGVHWAGVMALSSSLGAEARGFN